MWRDSATVRSTLSSLTPLAEPFIISTVRQSTQVPPHCCRAHTLPHKAAFLVLTPLAEPSTMRQITHVPPHHSRAHRLPLKPAYAPPRSFFFLAAVLTVFTCRIELLKLDSCVATVDHLCKLTPKFISFPTWNRIFVLCTIFSG